VKILMLAPEPFFTPRGTPISVYQRLRGLSDLGHEVDLLTYHIGVTPTIPGVTVHRTARIPLIEAVRPGPSFKKILLDLLLVFTTIRFLSTRSYDVIHSHEEAALFAHPLAGIFGTKHLYDMHSSLPRQVKTFRFWGFSLFAKVLRILELWAVKRSAAIITIAPDLEQHVRSIDPSAQCVMIENLPVQAALPEAEEGSVNRLRTNLGLDGRLPVVYTGNLQGYQGIDLLIQSAEIVKERAPEVVFLLVGGTPPEIAQWEEVVKSRGLEGFVRFTGTVPLEELPPYMALAEILVSPRTEGMSVPLKLYSYLYTGKSIVATEIPAHTLVLNEDTAVLVAPTKEGLAEGIITLAQNAALRDQLGLEARALAERKYNTQGYLSRLAQVYAMVMGSGRTLAPPSNALAG
jgi:glycosyltransferase involved in cell wall biosynthesis